MEGKENVEIRLAEQWVDVTTSTGEKVSRSDIENIFLTGINLKYPQVLGEVSYWFRGEVWIERLKNERKIATIHPNFSAFDFLSCMLFSERDALTQLGKPDIKSLIKEALNEARIYTVTLTSLQASLIYLTVIRMTSLEGGELLDYFLVLIEAIVNNRLTKACHLEAFLLCAKEVIRGKKTWSSFRIKRYTTTCYELPYHFFRRKELLRTYYTVLRLVKNWLKRLEMDKSLEESNKQIEISVQIFANNYSAKMYFGIPVAAEAIAKGMLRTREDVLVFIEFISKSEWKRNIAFAELEKYLKTEKNSTDLALPTSEMMEEITASNI